MAKKQDETVLEAAEEIGAEPRVYELGFHIDPELPSEEVKKVYQTVREDIASKGEVVAEVEPEKIALAYTISRQEVAGRRDFNSAYFAWIVYEATPEAHAELVSAAGANSSLIRFVDLLTTREAARHALEVHEMRERADEQGDPSDDKEALDTEIDAALEKSEV